MNATGRDERAGGRAGAVTIAKSLASIMLCVQLGIAFPPAQAKDKDPNSGTLIMAMGEQPGLFYLWYRWKLRPVGGIEAQLVEIMGVHNDFSTKRDFKGDELGRILTQALPEGDYEFVGFEVEEQVGWTIVTSKYDNFSMPFHIDAGKATYVGDFMAEIDRYRLDFFGRKIPESFYFVISDKNARDLPLARKLYPDLSEPTVSVVDADAARHPLLFSKVKD